MTDLSQYPNIANAFNQFKNKVLNPSMLIANYPRIIQAIDVLWGTEAGMDYLADLVWPKRDRRQGFSSDIMSEVIFLQMLHHRLYPEFAKISEYDPIAQNIPTIPLVTLTIQDKTKIDEKNTFQTYSVNDISPPRSQGAVEEWTSYPKLNTVFAPIASQRPEHLRSEHPEILKTIESLWGKVELDTYIDAQTLSDSLTSPPLSLGSLGNLIVIKKLHRRLFITLFQTTSAIDVADSIMTQKIDQSMHVKPSSSGDTTQTEKINKEPLNKKNLQVPASPSKNNYQNDALSFHLVSINELEADKKWPSIDSIAQIQKIIADRLLGHSSPPRDTRPLGEILLSYGLLSRENLDKALVFCMNQIATENEKRVTLGQVLIQQGWATPESIIRACCVQQGILQLSEDFNHPSTEALFKIPKAVRIAKQGMPLVISRGILFLGVSNPFSFAHTAEFSLLSNSITELVMVSRNHLKVLINK